MSPVYITCKVFPGIFDNEYYVTVNGSAAYYVNQVNIVKLSDKPTPERPTDGLVKGYLIEKAEGKVLVQLPGEAVVGGIRTWVESGAVSAAA